MSWDPSPGKRRLLFVCVVLGLTVVGVYLTAPELFGGTRDQARVSPEPGLTPEGSTRGGEELPSSPVTSASPTVVPSVSASPESDARAAYLDKALGFVNAFTSTEQSAEKWHDGVSRHCTEELADSLAYTDPRMVPEGKPTGEAKLRTTGETAVEVAVPLDSGENLYVTVTSVGERYAVSHVRPGDES